VPAVQIDIDLTLIDMRYPFEVNQVGDAAATLKRLLPLLSRQDDRSWRETVEANVRRWHEVMQRRAAVGAGPVNPDCFLESGDRTGHAGFGGSLFDEWPVLPPRLVPTPLRRCGRLGGCAWRADVTRAPRWVCVTERIGFRHGV
jgi:hypothetical protein